MVKQKIAVISASHGGHEVALGVYSPMRTMSRSSRPVTSFHLCLCGMELYLGGSTNAELVRSKPSDLEKYGGHVRNNAKVTGIDATNHTLIINNQELFTYDKAVLSVGVTPRTLNHPRFEFSQHYSDAWLRLGQTY